MMLALGNKCAGCGSAEHLTFDCREPMGGKHHQFDTSQRVSFYTSQMRSGNVQCLCFACNSIKADLSFAEWKSALLSAQSEFSNAPTGRIPLGEPGCNYHEFHELLRQHAILCQTLPF